MQKCRGLWERVTRALAVLPSTPWTYPQVKWLRLQMPPLGPGSWSWGAHDKSSFRGPGKMTQKLQYWIFAVKKRKARNGMEGNDPVPFPLGHQDALRPRGALSLTSRC